MYLDAWGLRESPFGAACLTPFRTPAFEEALARAATATDATLAAVLDRATAGTPPRLLAAMRHAVMTGGKRFRPFLVQTCCNIQSV